MANPNPNPGPNPDPTPTPRRRHAVANPNPNPDPDPNPDPTPNPRRRHAVARELVRPPLTLCHGDCHLENIFFGEHFEGGCMFIDFGLTGQR